MKWQPLWFLKSNYQLTPLHRLSAPSLLSTYINRQHNLSSTKLQKKKNTPQSK